MEEFTPLNLFGDENVDENKAVAEEKDVTEQPEEETVSDTDTASEEQEADEVDTPEVEYKDTDEEVEEEEPQNDKFDEVLQTQQLLLERIESLDKLFNARIMHTDYEEKIVDNMHKELQKYKEDMYAQLVRPILLDVIEVRDSILRIAATYQAKAEGEQDIPNKTFAGYAFDLQDILEKNDVEIYKGQEGDDFTPIKQRVVKKVATSEEILHGKVAESLSCGYSYNGRVISAEKISIYYYEKPIEEKEDSEVIENG